MGRVYWRTTQGRQTTLRERRDVSDDVGPSETEVHPDISDVSSG